MKSWTDPRFHEWAPRQSACMRTSLCLPQAALDLVYSPVGSGRTCRAPVEWGVPGLAFRDPVNRARLIGGVGPSQGAVLMSPSPRPPPWKAAAWQCEGTRTAAERLVSGHRGTVEPTTRRRTGAQYQGTDEYAELSSSVHKC